MENNPEYIPVRGVLHSEILLRLATLSGKGSKIARLIFDNILEYPLEDPLDFAGVDETGNEVYRSGSQVFVVPSGWAIDEYGNLVPFKIMVEQACQYKPKVPFSRSDANSEAIAARMEAELRDYLNRMGKGDFL